MTVNSGTSIWAVLIGMWILWTPPVHANTSNLATAGRILSVETQQRQEAQSFINRLAQANIVYLAETHDRVKDHQAQLEIVRSLHTRRPLIIGMEMFQRPFQWALDQYLAGQITEADLVQLTEYPKRWGYDWELYAPILRFAKQQQIPVMALNTPSEVTRKVARKGLDELTLAERQWIPPKSDLLATQPQTYRQRMRQFFDLMHQGKGSSTNFDRFLLAQVLWDETMAHHVERIIQRSPEALVIVLAGQGHILYKDGIPDRVERRLKERGLRSLQQVSVILNPSAEIQPEPGIADYFWYSP